MKRLFYLVTFLIFSGILAGAFLFPPHHPHYFWQKIPGFYAFLGFGGSLTLMTFAKLAGKYFLYRGEDYYRE